MRADRLRSTVPSPQTPSAEDLLERAHLLLHCRRVRKDLFDEGIFNEAAWDALLTLYVNEQAGLSVTIERLAVLVGTCLSSSVRWIDYLEEVGLLARRSIGGTMAVVRLSPKGRSDLESYLSRTLLAVP